MTIHLQLTGTLLILLAFMHIVFPKYFNWNKELNALSLINKQMMTAHTFFIALVVLLMGLLCLTSSDELIETNLGNKITFGLAIFWIIRLFFQLFIYSSKLWKDKKFETTIHIMFSLIWIYLSTVFSIISFS